MTYNDDETVKKQIILLLFLDSSPYCFGSELSNKKELVPSAKVEAYLAPFKNKLAQFEVGVQKTWGKVRNEGMRVYGGFRYKF